MLFCNDKLYEVTRSLKVGTSKLPRPMLELKSRIADCLNLEIVNIYYDTIDIGPAKGRPRLNLIVDSEDDFERLHAGPFAIKSEAGEAILREFSAIVEQMSLKNEYETRNVLLTVDCFSGEAMRRAVSSAIECDEKTLLNTFSSPGLWKIDSISPTMVVFFINERAKNLAASDGTAAKIRTACYESAKRFDEFNYISVENFGVHFDSKENLDKNFAGSLFYYFR
jgi:hypothetical protein